MDMNNPVFNVLKVPIVPYVADTPPVTGVITGPSPKELQDYQLYLQGCQDKINQQLKTPPTSTASTTLTSSSTTYMIGLGAILLLFLVIKKK